MTIKINSSFQFSIVLLLSLSIFWLAGTDQSFAQANEAVNCEAQLTPNADRDDWREQYMIHDQNDFVWQRTIIINPKRKLVLKEDEEIIIEGHAQPNAPVQLYTFSPQYDGFGRLLPPSEDGVCYEGVANSDGLFQIKFGPQIFWPLIGTDEFIIDAYTQLEEHWIGDDKRNITNQNYHIGTNVPPIVIAIEGERYSPALQNSPTVTQSNPGVAPGQSNVSPEQCSVVCEDSGVIQGIELDSSEFTGDSRYIDDAFNPLGHRKVTVGRTPGRRSYYSRIADGLPEPTIDELRDAQVLASNSLLLEVFKRFLLGELSVKPPIFSPLASISESEILAATNGEGDYSKSVTELLDNIRQLMVTETNKSERLKIAAKVLKSLEIHNWKDGKENAFDHIRDRLEILFKQGIADSDTWARDFVLMTDFWTGSTEMNTCLVTITQGARTLFHHSDDGAGSLGRFQSGAYNLCGFSFMQGVDPVIFLHSQESALLTPDFSAISLLNADRPFDNNESWLMPAGTSQKIMHYTYESQGDLADDSYIHTACLAKDDLDEYVNLLANNFLLNDRESDILRTEVDSILSMLPEHTVVSLADPNRIAENFKWKVDGQRLNSLPLFFKKSDSACFETALPQFDPATIQSLAERIDAREAFESGIIQ